MQRRHFLRHAVTGSTALGAGTLAMRAMADDRPAKSAANLGKVEHCVMLWLGGGMSQIDTFDPKSMGDARQRKPGSYYPSIETSVDGVRVCQHLSQTARRMEHVTAIRTVHHDVVDEHAAATNRMHTGRTTSGTVTYPSLGSIIAHCCGSADEKVPAYVLLGYPNITRGPGFLGPSAGFIYTTDLKRGPAGLARRSEIDRARFQRRRDLLQQVRTEGKARFAGDERFAAYDQAIEDSLRLGGPEFMSVFDLNAESAELRNRYQSDFGQRCLMARRLFQRGVRFVEISYSDNFKNGTGWDTHNQGQLNQHLLIEDLDAALATLIDDLQQHKMLDKTLIMINSEFGRPAAFDSGGGRGHHSKCFTCVLAGGGLNHRGAIGVSDALAQTPITQPFSVADLFATVLASMGIEPNQILHDGDRPVPVTDGGKPISDL